jgi:hypothetical protein
MKEIKLVVPDDYECSFDTQDPIQTKLILEMGSRMYEKMQVVIEEKDGTSDIIRKCNKEKLQIIEESNSKREQLTLCYNSEKEKLVNKYEAEIDSYRKALTSCKDKFVNIKTEITDQFDEKMALFVQSHEEKLADLTQTYEKKLANLTQTYEEKLNKVRENEKTIQAQLLAKQEEMTQVVSGYNSWAAGIISSFNTKTATQIGQEGEHKIAELLGQEFKHAEIINTSKMVAAGDILFSLDDVILMLEIKNKKTITKTDVDKFIRDTRLGVEKGTFHGAIFVSLSANIPRKGCFDLEIHDTFAIVWLTLTSESVLVQVINVMKKLTTYLKSVSGSSTDEQIKTERDLLSLHVNNMIKNVKLSITQIGTLEKSLIDISRTISSIKHNLSAMLTL